MLSVVYTSRATGTFDDADLATLLMNSRANNRRLGLTGFLLHKEGQFLQLLEGPVDTVHDRLGIIEQDPRHTDIAVLLEDEQERRQFPAWSMGYETVTDTLADDIPGYRALFQDINITPVLAEPAVRQLLAWFETRVTQPA
jgi:hypothetical protein